MFFKHCIKKIIPNALIYVNKLSFIVKCDYCIFSFFFGFFVHFDSLNTFFIVVLKSLVPFGKICTWKISHTFRPFSEQLFTIMFPMMLSGACAAGVLGCYCGVSVVVTSVGDTADSICPGSEPLCGEQWTDSLSHIAFSSTYAAN